MRIVIAYALSLLVLVPVACNFGDNSAVEINGYGHPDAGDAGDGD
jgi:hypothetical protein